jgi:hypothetical protein
LLKKALSSSFTLLSRLSARSSALYRGFRCPLPSRRLIGAAVFACVFFACTFFFVVVFAFAFAGRGFFRLFAGFRAAIALRGAAAFAFTRFARLGAFALVLRFARFFTLMTAPLYHHLVPLRPAFAWCTLFP